MFRAVLCTHTQTHTHTCEYYYMIAKFINIFNTYGANYETMALKHQANMTIKPVCRSQVSPNK